MPVVKNHPYNNNHHDHHGENCSHSHERPNELKFLSVNTLQNSPFNDNSPVSPIIARKKYIASQTPFAPESEDEVKFGINDSNEEHKFTSYHLDYKYTPPIHKGPCSVCNNYIIGSMVTACEKMYCPGCFLCTNCGVELRPAFYKAHDERPYCRKCHSQLFLPPCHHCGDYLGEQYLKAGDKYYHKPCFTCSKCKKVLDPKRYFEKDGKLYCEDDFNNLFKPKCTKCYKPIIEDGVTGGGKPYHRQCLSCHECNKGLNPGNFFEKNGNLFCPDCYHKLYSPHCSTCKKPIKTGDPLVARGKSYHPNCFNCAECSKSLNPSNYMEKNNKNLCPDCFHNLYSPKCFSCKKPITNGDPVNAKGKEYHKHCFNCSECTRPLNPSNFMDKNNKLFCPDCFHNLYSPKCAECKNPISNGEPLRASGKDFHKNCFKCAECKRGLDPNNYKDKNGKAYCPDCFHNLFSPKCYGCKQPITSGEVVHALGQTWHPNHFSCSNCSRNLSPKDYKQKDGKLFCPDCFNSLFSQKCTTCHEYIKDKALFAMGKYYHPDHFRCRNCSRELGAGEFYEHDSSGFCEECYLKLFAPKCRGCSNAIKNQVYLFALNSNWHETCFRCTECKCLLKENTFYEFEGEPYCEEHYHARICPDCIKMRRAVERYLGQAEGSSSKPDSVAAYRTLNLPPISKSGSTLNVNSHNEMSVVEKSGGFNNQIGTHTHLRMPERVEERSEIERVIKRTTEEKQMSMAQNQILNSNNNSKTYSTLQEPITKQSDSQFISKYSDLSNNNSLLRNNQFDTSDFNTNFPSIFPTNFNDSNNFGREYLMKDSAFSKSSGAYNGDPNLHFESTFQKEVSESITRY